MKKIFFTIVITVISSAIIYAQALTPNAVINTPSATFVTKQVGASNNMTVDNSKNVYHNKIPKNRNSDITIDRKDKADMLISFRQVFSKARLEQLLSERYIMMTLYVSPTGQVLEVRFLLHNNTLLTALELESLENALKKNVVFIFRPEQIKGEDFIDISWLVPYKRVLDSIPH